MKKVSRRELARTITRQLIEGKDPQRVTLELAAYLVDKKMTAQAGMLLSDIAGFLQAETGHVSAEAKTAFSLTSENRQELEQFIKQTLSAKSIELTTSEDKSLIGGVVIKTPGYEYDASVRRKLNALARGEA